MTRSDKSNDPTTGSDGVPEIFDPRTDLGFEFQTYYDLLGVESSADTDEIKTAYRDMAKTHHPDISSHADAETRFKQLSEAKRVLTSTAERRAYHQQGHIGYYSDGTTEAKDTNSGSEGDTAGSEGGSSDGETSHASRETEKEDDSKRQVSSRGSEFLRGEGRGVDTNAFSGTDEPDEQESAEDPSTRKNEYGLLNGIRGSIHRLNLLNLVKVWKKTWWRRFIYTSLMLLVVTPFIVSPAKIQSLTGVAVPEVPSSVFLIVGVLGGAIVSVFTGLKVELIFKRGSFVDTEDEEYKMRPSRMHRYRVLHIAWSLILTGLIASAVIPSGGENPFLHITETVSQGSVPTSTPFATGVLAPVAEIVPEFSFLVTAVFILSVIGVVWTAPMSVSPHLWYDRYIHGSRVHPVMWEWSIVPAIAAIVSGFWLADQAVIPGGTATAAGGAESLLVGDVALIGCVVLVAVPLLGGLRLYVGRYLGSVKSDSEADE